ncbi:cytochrome C biogenesis protein [Lysobacter pythonis]|uniref:Cytochrome C biogenesis protein n=1 Tax=Solilutibacter pythonis TaxID=2483112 RepID=A0A3M2I3U1_9GAMM|nr:protein-disulfide reductase DsbD [Lysobacter pythonis]RMH92894.1 cytochrome C biogenesis protein [Lysobacter pythonis]
MPLFIRGFAALLLAFVCPSALPQAMDPGDLPPVDSVFKPHAEATTRERIDVRWRIAPGYYLYRHRTQVTPLGGFEAGELQISDGKKHHDEFFGDVETYRGELKVALPGKAQSDTVALRIKYQGCADIGVCYPPQTRTVTVRLPGGETQRDAGFAALGAKLGGGTPPGGSIVPGQNAMPLPPARAFKVEAIADGGNRLLLRVAPARGYYLYRDKLTLRLEGATGIALGEPRFPPARDHRDEHFGAVKVYFDETDIPVPLARDGAGAKPQTVTLHASWQGCQDNGICYEPMKKSFRLALPAMEATTRAAAVATDEARPGKVEAAAAAPPGGEAAPATPPSTRGSDDAAPTPPPGSDGANDDTNATPAASATGGQRRAIGLAAALLFALIGGLILNLMPCVLPVLSLKALALAQSGENRATARRHALWYTLGVLAAFAVLGGVVLALRSRLLAQGMGWGFQLQLPWLVAALALVVFAFGLSLSGLWHAQVAAPQAGLALAGKSGRRGDFFTGVLAVVLATPCTAPFMGGALAYAFVAPAPAAMGVFLMLGLGLALPFLLIGFVPALARFLPKPGAWMETMKQLLAFPMYATAAWLVWVLAQQRGADAFGLWALAAILLAMALWAWTHARRDGKRWALGLAVLALGGSIYAIHAIGQLARPASAPATAADSTPGRADAHAAYSAARLAQLRAEGRPVFVNITADWCVTCKANERAVFARQGFREALAETGTVYMVGDHTDVDPAISAFLQQHGAVGLPLYVSYPKNGGAPRVLPTLLTPAIVHEALREAAR